MSIFSIRRRQSFWLKLNNKSCQQQFIEVYRKANYVGKVSTIQIKEWDDKVLTKSQQLMDEWKLKISVDR